MIEFYLRNRKYINVIEVFEKMRRVGYFFNLNVIVFVLNVYGKVREFERVDMVYREM